MLDVFRELGLLTVREEGEKLHVELVPDAPKANLNDSAILSALRPGSP